MTKTRNIPTRFSETFISEMDKASDEMGLDNRSDLIKLCVKTFLRYYALYGRQHLPPDWKQILKDMDGRGLRYKK